MVRTHPVRKTVPNLSPIFRQSKSILLFSQKNLAYSGPLWWIVPVTTKHPMEIEITSLLETDQFALSHSAAEGGQSAGQDTWRASLDAAAETPLLDTPEKLQAMRDFALSSGGWDAEEIAAWSNHEVNALFLQWIAGDCRQCPAILEGVEFKEREPDDGWYHSSDEWEYETGPFESRSDAYHDAAPQREPRADSLDEIDWPEYEVQANAGRISGNISRADDGRIFFYLGN